MKLMYYTRRKCAQYEMVQYESLHLTVCKVTACNVKVCAHGKSWPRRGVTICMGAVFIFRMKFYEVSYLERIAV